MNRLPDLPGHYRIEKELKERMEPKEVKPSAVKLMLIEAGYLLATAVAGLAVMVGIIVFCGFVACFWVMRKIWRAWK